MRTNTNLITSEYPELDKPFEYRSYGKGELSMLYIPNIQQQSAVDLFNKWLETSPGLLTKLYQTGYNRRNRYYTPAQVKLIVTALGEP